MEANAPVDFSNISYKEAAFNFEVLFKDRPLKYVGICFACVSMLIILFLCYGIIWFERFGSGNLIFFQIFFVCLWPVFGKCRCKLYIRKQPYGPWIRVNTSLISVKQGKNICSLFIIALRCC
jgi:hypothetical protein